MTHYVYIYKNPLNENIPFYVGKGKGQRYLHHLSPCMLRNDSHKSRVINKILAAGIKPVIELIPCDTEEEALNKEIDLIAQFKRIIDGGTLVNNLIGGDNPPSNKGVNHPKYGSGNTYKITHIKSGETFVTNALFHWASLKGLSGSALKELADNKVVKYTTANNPVRRKQYKGYLCKILD